MTASKHEYTAEFKEEAVRLVISSQKSCAEIARNLGIAPYLVVRWKQQHEQRGAVGRPPIHRTGGRSAQRAGSAVQEARARTRNYPAGT